MKSQITRREFTAGVLAAGTIAAARPRAHAAGGANERVRLGFIGVGNRGDQLLDAFTPHADAEVAAICDVYEPYVEFARQKVGGDPFATKDYREVLDRKDIDAVVIATPDHWHALQFIDACAAGKDVYVEKPLSLVISEGRRMVEAATRHDRITQVGTHRRSSVSLAEAVKLIHDGAIGKVTSARCDFIRNECPMGIGRPADCDPPAGLDWDTWLGPAPKVPYNPNRCFYKFRWFRSYSGGQVTNFGTHYLDLIQWALQQDAPAGVFAAGGRYAVEDNREVPDTLEVIWEYAGGTLVTLSQYNANGAPAHSRPGQVEFRGTLGTMYVNRNNYEIVGETNRKEALPVLSPVRRQEDARQNGATGPVGKVLSGKGGDSAVEHARSFLDGIKTRKPCTAPVEVGHRSTSATLLANVSFDRRRYITWDRGHERVTNDPDANQLLAYDYRPPWKLPAPSA